MFFPVHVWISPVPQHPGVGLGLGLLSAAPVAVAAVVCMKSLDYINPVSEFSMNQHRGFLLDPEVS